MSDRVISRINLTLAFLKTLSLASEFRLLSDFVTSPSNLGFIEHQSTITTERGLFGTLPSRSLEI